MKLFIAIYFVIVAFGIFVYAAFCTIQEIQGYIPAAEVTVVRTETKAVCEQYNSFKSLLAAVEPNEYKKVGNNCYDYSKRLQAQLVEHGIRSSIFITKDRTHAFLGVWVEATEGGFVSPDKNYQIMEVRSGAPNYNVICSNE